MIPTPHSTCKFVLPFVIDRTTKDIVKSLSKYIDESTHFDMVARQSSVLSDALRRMVKSSFDLRKRLNVCSYIMNILFTSILYYVGGICWRNRLRCWWPNT